MKSTDLNPRVKKPALIVLLNFLALAANAVPTNVEGANQTHPLILTLSDEWLESNASTRSNFRNADRVQNGQLITTTAPSSATSIGCNMDISSISTTDTSLTSRVVGRCHVNYRY